jgi:hypothetical protein
VQYFLARQKGSIANAIPGVAATIAITDARRDIIPNELTGAAAALACSAPAWPERTRICPP